MKYILHAIVLDVDIISLYLFIETITDQNFSLGIRVYRHCYLPFSTTMKWEELLLLDKQTARSLWS